MKKLLSFLLTLTLFFTLCTSAQAASVCRTKQALTVDGKSVTCDIYAIDGYNYFKLRDLAYLLRGTGSRFDVGYNAAANSVTVTTGKDYAPVGGELVIGADKSATAQVSRQSIFIDGVRCDDLSAYALGGNNYFKLRDVGKAVGFDVDYDAATNTMIVESHSFDPKQNAAMSWQYGNFLNNGSAVETDDAVYYLLYTIEPADGDAIFGRVSHLVERRDDGALRTLCSVRRTHLEKLSADEAGFLYFVEPGIGNEPPEKLVRFDPVTGATKTLYETAKEHDIDSYLFYDGKLYVVDSYITDSWDHVIKILSVGTNGKAETLVSLSKNDSIYVGESLYAYGGKLYYLASDGFFKGTSVYYQSLFSYDLAAKKTVRVVDGNRGDDGTDLLASSCTAYVGHYVYSISTRGENSGDMYLSRVDLLDPQDVTVVADVPANAEKWTPYLFANGNSLFFQSSEACGLWSVRPDGTFQQIAKMSLPYDESGVVTRQAAIAFERHDASTLWQNRTFVYPAGGGKMQLCAFLGYPYVTVGKNLFPAAEEKVFAAESTLALSASECDILPLRSYRNAAGDLVTEVYVSNPTDTALTNETIILAYVDDASYFGEAFYTDSTIPAHGSAVFSLILPASRSAGVDLASLQLDTGWMLR